MVTVTRWIAERLRSVVLVVVAAAVAGIDFDVGGTDAEQDGEEVDVDRSDSCTLCQRGCWQVLVLTWLTLADWLQLGHASAG